MATGSATRRAPRATAPYPELALAVLGILSILPPYIGPPLGLELNVAAKVEVVDHVVPGVLVMLCGGLSALLARRAGAAEPGAAGLAFALALAGLCFLAGLWQLSTHVPLVLDGGNPGVPWGAVVLHSTAGPLIVALALRLMLRDPPDRAR